MVSWLVNKYCHVSATRRDVIRLIYSKLTDEYKGKEYKALRKEAYKEALQTHQENRRLYHAVVTGKLGK